MNEDKSRQLWKIIQEAGDYLKGQLPNHPNHPKGRNPYAHVAICVRSKYGERYVTAIWDNIKINREEGSIILTPSLASIFLDLFKKEETKDLVLNCEEINKRDLPKEKIDKKF